MKDLFLDKSINIIGKYYKKYNSEEIERLRYGLEGIYLTVFKLFLILGFSLYIGIFKEVFLVLLAYNCLRFFAFGMHAKSSKECLILSTLLFVLFPYLVFSNFIVFKFSNYIYILSIFGFLFFAPSDTIKRPLFNNRKRLIRKVCSVLIVIFYFVVSHFFLNNFFDSILITSTLIELVMINPITYKLFGQPYNNYKNIGYR